MKQALRLSCALFAALFIFGVLTHVSAQTATPTPTPTPGPTPAGTPGESFTAQISSSTNQSFASDISGDGRFVVIESNGDIATEKNASRNNSDGNREIFLFDYAQRRIFQITNTQSARKDATKPDYDPANLIDQSNVVVSVSNNRPFISNNGRWIVFSSNASNPAGFDGGANLTALQADGNQEIFLYRIPDVPAATLSAGADVPITDLSTGTFQQVTNTPASRKPIAGSTTVPPFVADDNRNAMPNDDASAIVFVSTRDLVTGGNTDGNPEIFIFDRTNSRFSQVTNTTGAQVFNENPSISGQPMPGSVAIAFISNANISAGGGTNNGDGNAEVYLASYNGAVSTITRQVTNTTAPSSNAGFTVNVLSLGRRLSRDGSKLAFESAADLAADRATQTSLGTYVYNIASNSFTQIGLRNSCSDVLRFPTFTGDSSTLVFASSAFQPDANFTGVTDQCGASNRMVQIFSTPAPPAAPVFARLTNFPHGTSFRLQPLVSNTQQRMAFTLEGVEIGGGNPEFLGEAYYMVAQPQPFKSDATALSFFTAASNMSVAAPGTSPTPTPPTAPALAPGELGIIRSASSLAPSAQTICSSTAPNCSSASASGRAPGAPIEINGVSVSVNGAAAGLFSVAPGQINFIVPRGLAAGVYPVVVNNNGAIIRGSLQVNAAQPDIFTSTNDAGGRAAIFLAGTMTGEPFTVASDGSTEVSLFLTGVRNVTKAQVTVSVGTGDKKVDITGSNITLVSPTDTPGFDQINFKLPASLAGAGNQPIVVTVNINGTIFTSRPAASAPSATFK